MKKGIHPDYQPVVFKDATTGTAFLTRSTLGGSGRTPTATIDWETPDGIRTYPLIVLDVTSDSHPFWTGRNRVLDAAGQVEKFRRRYGSRDGSRSDARDGSRGAPGSA
jgi:large subunit ribosomal protein L31